MRSFILIGALAGALVASRGAAEVESQQGKSSDPHPAAQETRKDPKGYGYGEQPGKSDDAAKQEAGEGRKPSDAPQDERPPRVHGDRSARESATGAAVRAVSGEIVKTGERSVSVRDADRRVHELRVDEHTRVLRDGREVPVESLQEGESVRASYDTRGGGRVATTISLLEKGAREPPSYTEQGRESGQRQEGAPSGAGRKTEPRQEIAPSQQGR